MDKEKRTIKGFYSQQGFSRLTGLAKSTVSQHCTDGIFDVFFTEDGKRIIKADPKVVAFYQKKNEHKLKKS